MKRSAEKFSNSSGDQTKLYRWSLQDEVFFERYEDLNDDQIRFYLRLRKGWMRQGGAALIVEKWTANIAAPELADAVKDIQQLVDQGFILREDTREIARRILVLG